MFAQLKRQHDASHDTEGVTFEVISQGASWDLFDERCRAERGMGCKKFMRLIYEGKMPLRDPEDMSLWILRPHGKPPKRYRF